MVQTIEVGHLCLDVNIQTDWIRDPSRVELGDEHTGQRRIILMKKHLENSSPSDISERPAHRKTFSANQTV